MNVYFISFLLPLLSFGCILCNILPEEIVHEKGGYTQWREKLGFLPCEPAPEWWFSVTTFDYNRA